MTGPDPNRNETGRAATATRPSFIVFMTDQQRADHLGCYGNPVVRTPHIDAIAERGVRFENVFTATPICQPNRASLITGQMPSVNGCRQNGIPVSLDSTTVADVLRAAGYRTGLVGKAHFQNVSPVPASPRALRGRGNDPVPPYETARRDQRTGPEYGAETSMAWARDPGRQIPLPYYGFEHVRLCIGHGDQVEGHYSGWLQERLNGAPDPRGRAQALPDDTSEAPQIWRTALPEDLYPTAYIAEEACAFLEETDERPFFLVVSFPDPHHPFTPPGRYFDLYDPDAIALPASFAHPTGAREDLPDSLLQGYARGDADRDAYWPFHAAADTTRRMIALNYGAITMIDDRIGQVLAALDAVGRADDTVLCVMSDHGDYMGDHGTMLKHGLHTRGVINVPFLWADPQGAQGRVSRLHGSAIDFAPTVLQRAGLKIPVGMQGHDLLADDAPDLPVLIEDPGMGVYGDPDADSSIRSVVFRGWRLSVFEGSDLGELYDLNTDPDELVNLWAEPTAQSKRAEMLLMLIQRQIALRDKAVLATHQA
ncbi:sulfatase family protein [Pararhodobacter marinus]|uniref:sulfatase family protein n=1 Tax=Pararhodobacter marinus TaxID=2184063 RepID=UPI0035194EAB